MTSPARLDLRQIETFLAVIATGSFHEAGRRLGIAQPTVSQHIRKLEESVRAALVERSPAGCRPTEAARTFMPYAESLLRIARRATEATAGRPLVVGSSGNIGIYILPEIVRRFELSPEGAPVDIVIAPNPEVAERLERAEVDIALLEWWDNRAGFVAASWRQEPLVAIVAPDHAWARLRAVPADTVRAAPLLGGEPGTGTGRLLQEALGEAGSVARRLGSTEAVKRAVRAGLGVSIVLAATVADEVAAGTLAAVPIAGDTPLTKTLWAVRREHLASTAPEWSFLRHLA